MTECCGKISMSILPRPNSATAAAANAAAASGTAGAVVPPRSMSVEERLKLVCTSGRPFGLVRVRLVREDGQDVEPGSGTSQQGFWFPIGFDIGSLISPLHSRFTGQVGEVWCRGATVFNGYLRLPDASAEAFADGWFRTGDLATLHANGYISVVDRKKDMVRHIFCYSIYFVFEMHELTGAAAVAMLHACKQLYAGIIHQASNNLQPQDRCLLQILVGGENVYCTEVEAALYAHPSVSQAAVFGVPHVVLGEMAHAAVVLKAPPAGEKPMLAGEAAGQLVAWCRARLAHYKVPAEVRPTMGRFCCFCWPICAKSGNRLHADGVRYRSCAAWHVCWFDRAT